MDWLGAYLPILGSRPQNRMAAHDAHHQHTRRNGMGRARRCGDDHASTGAPPNNALTASARRNRS